MEQYVRALLLPQAEEENPGRRSFYMKEKAEWSRNADWKRKERQSEISRPTVRPRCPERQDDCFQKEKEECRYREGEDANATTGKKTARTRFSFQLLLFLPPFVSPFLLPFKGTYRNRPYRHATRYTPVRLKGTEKAEAGRWGIQM